MDLETIKVPRGKVTRRTFYGIGELADHARQGPIGHRWNPACQEGNSFYSTPNCKTNADAMALLDQGGNATFAEQARAAIRKYRLEGVQALIPVPELAPVGVAPCVPVVATGQPNCWIAEDEQPTAGVPATVYVELTSSARINVKHLVTRGATILELLLACTATRPTRAVLVCTGDHAGSRTHAMCARIILDPPYTDAEIALLFSAPAITRSLLYSILNQDGNSHGQWPFQDRKGAVDALPEYVKGRDLFIPSLHAKDDAAVTDPRRWLKTELDTLGIRLRD